VDSSSSGLVPLFYFVFGIYIIQKDGKHQRSFTLLDIIFQFAAAPNTKLQRML
jgi:hypothetical protein